MGQKAETSKPKKTRREFTAREKAQAVLSVWSEKRKPSEVCRELGIAWSNLRHWQNKAMEGMISALEPRTREEEQKGPALASGLEKLLETTSEKLTGASKLSKRLEKVQTAAKDQ
jgi:transposase-like protein